MTLVRHLIHHSRLWQGLLALTVLAILYLATAGSPRELPSTGLDKINHLLAFAVLAVQWRLAFPRMRLVGVILGLLGYGVLIELIQLPLPHRSAEGADVLADALGVALGLGVHAVLMRCLPAPASGRTQAS